MKTYPIYLEDNTMVAFEVDSGYITIKQIKELFTKKTSAIGFSRKDRFARRKYDCHIFFKYKDKEFGVIEPFGDNSRYWIGPLEGIDESDIDVTELESSVRSYRPFWAQIIFAKIFTLDFVGDVLRKIKFLNDARGK